MYTIFVSLTDGGSPARFSAQHPDRTGMTTAIVKGSAGSLWSPEDAFSEALAEVAVHLAAARDQLEAEREDRAKRRAEIG